MNYIAFGDSLIGTDADSKGGLGQHLDPFMASVGVKSLEPPVGVGASTSGHWAYSGGLSGATRGPGRWAQDHSNKINQAQADKADLDRIAKKKPNFVWITLGTNDSANNISFQQFQKNIEDISRKFDPRTMFIITNGNRGNDGWQLMEQLKKVVPKNFLVIVPDSDIYNGEGMHPNEKVHEKFLKAHREEIKRFVNAGGIAQKASSFVDIFNNPIPRFLGAIASFFIFILTLDKLLKDRKK